MSDDEIRALRAENARLQSEAFSRPPAALRNANEWRKMISGWVAAIGAIVVAAVWGATLHIAVAENTAFRKGAAKRQKSLSDDFRDLTRSIDGLAGVESRSRAPKERRAGSPQ